MTGTEYDGLVGEAKALLLQLKTERSTVGEHYRHLRKDRKMWQSFVVVSAAISTGLAGYVAQTGLDLRWRLVLVFVVALTGAVAAVRDAWQVNEDLDDARNRYSEIKGLSASLTQAMREADGRKSDENRLGIIGPAVRDVQRRLVDLTDDLSPVQKSA